MTKLLIRLLSTKFNRLENHMQIYIQWDSYVCLLNLNKKKINKTDGIVVTHHYQKEIQLQVLG